MSDVVKDLKIYAMATDPIYIGTGGYTIGRVDNTIVRDPITNVPKIPGSSLAGTWRYYVVLEALKDIKDKQPNWDDIKNHNGDTLKTIGEKLENYNWNNNKPSTPWKAFSGNQIIKIKCAGQDDAPQVPLEKAPESTGHCGHCIVCKGFGFSKKDISWQGQIFFSDLNILFFPVFTMKGTKWITTASRLREVGVNSIEEPSDKKIKAIVEGSEDNKYLNLGWLYLEVEGSHNIEKDDSKSFKFNNFELEPEDIIIVPENLFPHIVNSNLEVRTSVSIDPITGAAKEGALFTSEAIPRGTIFYGSIRIFDKKNFEDLESKLKPLPDVSLLEQALEDSKHFYETLGIGGMTTRGFGRLKINMKECFESETNGGDRDEQSANQ